MGAVAPNEGASLFQFHKGTIKPAYSAPNNYICAVSIP